MAKRNFFEGPLYTITNYIYWFSVTNIYFILMNLFLVMFLLLPVEPADVNAGYYLMFYLVLLPVGPSLTALLSVMGKLVRDGDASVTKDYFKAYKQNFKQSLFIWFIGLTMISIMLADINFFATKGNASMLIPVFNGMIIIMLILGLYVFPIVSRFYMKASDIVKLSFYYAIKKFKVTILNIIGIIGVGLLIKTFPSISIFFFASIACYMIMYYEKDILKELEEKIGRGSGDRNTESEDAGSEEEIEEDLLAKDIENSINKG